LTLTLNSNANPDTFTNLDPDPDRVHNPKNEVMQGDDVGSGVGHVHAGLGMSWKLGRKQTILSSKKHKCGWV